MDNNYAGEEQEITTTQSLGTSTFTINSTLTTPACRSRLTIAPGFAINLTKDMPNALVRFFHKHLFNFTWEKL
jgi:hypothetical protein